MARPMPSPLPPEVPRSKTAAGAIEQHSYLHVVLTAAQRGNNLVLFFPPIVDAKAPDANSAPKQDAKNGEKK